MKCTKYREIIKLVLILTIIFSSVAAFLAVTRQGSFVALDSFDNEVLGVASLQGISISKVKGTYFLFVIILLTVSLVAVCCFSEDIREFVKSILKKAGRSASLPLSDAIKKHYTLICFTVMSVIPIPGILHFKIGTYTAILASVYLCLASYLLSRFGKLQLIRSAVCVLALSAIAGIPVASLYPEQYIGTAVKLFTVTLILCLLLILKRVRNAIKPLMVCSVVMPWILLLIRQLVIHGADTVWITVITVLFSAAALLWMFLAKTGEEPGTDLIAFAFISLVFAGALTRLFGTFSPNLLEGSNHGYAVYDTIKNGRFPILENFDAHMLSNYLPSLIDALISGSIHYGNQRVGYEIYLFLGLLIHYYFFRCFYEKEASLTLLFFAPLSLLNYKIYTINSSEHIIVMGLALVLLFRQWWKKRTFLTDIVLWAALAFSLLFSLDIGASFGVATLTAAVAACLSSKDKKRIISFFAGGALVTAICLALFFILCRMHDLDIKSVITKFLNATLSSDQNWAYGIYTQPKQMIGIAMVYVVMPVFIIPFTIYTLHKDHQKNDPAKYMTVIILLAFLLNLPRTLVRHTIFDKYSHFIWLLILLLIIAVRELKNAVNIMIPVIIVMMFVSYEHSIWSTSILPITNAEYDMISFDSFDIEDAAEKESYDLKEVLNALLSEDQTYLDFTNQTLLYQYVDKEKPVYVNQSPALVNGRIGQEQFLEEIRSCDKDVAIALMLKDPKNVNAKLDGVPNTDRYFLISTYINNNYSPLGKIDGYVILAKNELYQSMLKKAEGIKYMKTVSGLSKISEDHFRHELQNIPYLWGTCGNAGDEILSAINPYDEREAAKAAEKLCSYEGAVYCRINISAVAEGDITLTFGYDETDKCTEYSFLLKPGTNDYAFCVSSDMLWSTYLFDRLSVEADTDYKINGLYFAGDDISK